MPLIVQCTMRRLRPECIKSKKYLEFVKGYGVTFEYTGPCPVISFQQYERKCFNELFLNSLKRNLVQLRARADNLNADVDAKFNLGWIFVRKKDGVNVPALTKQPGNFSVKKKKDAKNVLLGKSHLCFNQELQKHTLFPLTGLDWLCMDSRFRFFSPH